MALNFFKTSYLRFMLKVGILGGGQLGRMLLQAAANYPVETYVLEADEACPAAHLCHQFVKGSITDFETVYQFGKNLDALTIEIENVNLDALEKLESEGKKIYPKPSVLRIIQNKIAQKEYYKQHNIPTAPFIITQHRGELHQHKTFLPAVHKIGQGGYDGRGVQLLHTASDFDAGFDAPSVLEKKVDVQKELAQLVAVDQQGKMVLYPSVEMVFNKQLNLLDYQLCPANITKEILWKVEAIAIAVVRNFGSPGLFAVELFLDHGNEVLVNETAPRVHNSGHHTIEAHYSSQFDMLWRIILSFPLGNTKAILPSAMVNIIGSDGYTGLAHYEGLPDVLAIDNTFVHLYGKQHTKPGRKMGHVTILSAEKTDLVYKAHKIKQLLSVISEPQNRSPVTNVN